MPQRSLRAFGTVLFASLLASLVGCGGESFTVRPVSGRVTLNGKPYAKGIVAFQPVGDNANPNPGPGSTAYTDSEGKFTLKIDPKTPGAVVGRHTVKLWTQMSASSANDESSGWREPIPTRYNNDSKEEFVVPPEGTDQANFDLKSP
jgi:hypothetical protein